MLFENRIKKIKMENCFICVKKLRFKKNAIRTWDGFIQISQLLSIIEPRGNINHANRDKLPQCQYERRKPCLAKRKYDGEQMKLLYSVPFRKYHYRRHRLVADEIREISLIFIKLRIHFKLSTPLRRKLELFIFEKRLKVMQIYKDNNFV